MGALLGIINKKNTSVALSQSITTLLSHSKASSATCYYQNENIFFQEWNDRYNAFTNTEIILNSNLQLSICADALLFNRTALINLLNPLLQNKISDNELILLAFIKWGKDCVHYLEGEFAFAIWNNNLKELFIATDHIGYRPFYYYNDDNSFIFCTEIKGVEAVKQLPHYFNMHMLTDYNMLTAFPQETYNKDIFLLPGARRLTVRANGHIETNLYWQLEACEKYRFKKPEQFFEVLYQLLYEAFENRLNADLPAGVMLSGGIDSTAVTCLLSAILKKKNKPLYTFSSVLPENYKGKTTDEKKYIDIVNKHCGNTIPAFIASPANHFYSDLQQAFDACESFPQLFHFIDTAILKQAEQQNIKALFTGYGGDSFLSASGNRVIFQLMQQHAYGKALCLAKQVAKVENTNPFYELAKRTIPYTKWYWQYRHQIKTSKKNIFTEDLLQKNVSRLHTTPQAGNIYLNNPVKSSISAIMANLLANGGAAKNMAMATNRNACYGIRAFTPFFDKNVNELLATLPFTLNLYNGHDRSVLKHTVKHLLPQEIFLRKDKTLYDPMYKERYFASLPQLKKILNAPKYQYLAAYLFNSNYINTFINQPFINDRSLPKPSIRLIQAGIILPVIHHIINKKGYLLPS